MKHVVQFSGGVGSWAASRRLVDRGDIGEGDELVLLFADTKEEDPDLYRFIEEAAANVGGQLVKIADGRTVWEVFKDRRMIGNTQFDPCSEVLKRKLLRKWIEDHCTPDDTVVHFGIDWTEIHRLDRTRPRWEPWTITAPLCEEPYRTKEEMMGRLQLYGIEPPSLYAYGFPHNNCGGFCVKAGLGQFALLWRTFPDRYAYHEQKERELREYLGKDVAILRDRRGGKTKPMTLEALRLRLEAGENVGRDMGGCGCAMD